MGVIQPLLHGGARCYVWFENGEEAYVTTVVASAVRSLDVLVLEGLPVEVLHWVADDTDEEEGPKTIDQKVEEYRNKEFEVLLMNSTQEFGKMVTAKKNTDVLLLDLVVGERGHRNQEEFAAWVSKVS